MGIIEFAIFSYALTAVISFIVIGVVVIANKIMTREPSRNSNLVAQKSEA